MTRTDPRDIRSATPLSTAVTDVEEMLAASQVVLYSTVVEDGRMIPVRVSGNVAHVLGYSVEEALAPGWWWQNVHPADRQSAGRSAGEVLVRGQYSHEYRFRHANGTYLWILDQMKLTGGGGKPGVVGSWTDVSVSHDQRERLAAAEAHYGRLIRTSPYAIYTLDVRGIFTEINDAGERMLGRTDVLGRAFLDVIAPRDHERAIAYLEQLRSGRTDALDVEIHILRPDGSERLLSASASPILNEGVHGIARDITEERRIAHERERALQQYERLVMTSPDAIYALDLDGRFTEVSRATAELLDRSADEIIGMPFGAIIAPEDLPAAAASFNSKISGEAGTTQIDVHIVRRNGERRLVRIRATQIIDGGRVLGSHGIARDITAERAREERMRLLAAALERLPDGVSVIDAFHRVVYANSAYSTLLGRDAGPAADGGGAPADMFAGAVDGPELALAMDIALQEHSAWRGTFTHQSSAGGSIPIEVVSVNVTVDEHVLTFSVLRDISEEIAREQQLRRAERLASVTTLVAGVAHELNNPLTAIAGFAELMLLESRSDDDRELLTLTRREADRAAKIVADLRVIARDTQDVGHNERRAVDLNDIVHHVLKLQRYTLDTTNVEVIADLAPDLPPVHGSSTELEQVVLNLIVNAQQAFDASHTQQRRITVHTRSARGGALLRITDNGPGITPENLEHIFDPFYTTKSPGEGMGLGLSLVHRIVTEHDGQVQVESTLGDGATFTVTLPRARTPAATAPRDAAPHAGDRLSILVVDDEEPIRRALLRYLERRGHRVAAASDGAEALKLIERHSYDVILSDLRMPGMGGERLVDTLREQDPDAARRVMFMTGHVARDDAALMAGYADVPLIEKPFSLSEIGRSVEEMAVRVRDPG